MGRCRGSSAGALNRRGIDFSWGASVTTASGKPGSGAIRVRNQGGVAQEQSTKTSPRARIWCNRQAVRHRFTQSCAVPVSCFTTRALHYNKDCSGDVGTVVGPCVGLQLVKNGAMEVPGSRSRLRC